MSPELILERLYYQIYLFQGSPRYGQGVSYEVFQTFCKDNPQLLKDSLHENIEAVKWFNTDISLLDQDEELYIEAQEWWWEIFKQNHEND